MSALSRALEGDPRDVEGDDLLVHFAAKDWKPETRKGAKNACVSYFRWLKASGRSEADPSEFLPTVKRPEPHPRPCPDVVILAALRKATDGERLMLWAYRNFCGALDWFSLSVGGVGVSRGGVEFVPVDAGPVCGRDAVVRFGRRCLFALPQGVGDE